MSWQTYGRRKRLRFTFTVPCAPGGEHSAGMRIRENPLLVLTAGKDRNIVILFGGFFSYMLLSKTVIKFLPWELAFLGQMKQGKETCKQILNRQSSLPDFIRLQAVAWLAF